MQFYYCPVVALTVECSGDACRISS